MKTIVIFIVSAFLFLVLVPFDSHADDQYACVKKNNGQFRLVDDPEDCRPSEYYVEIELDDDSELEGELCWTNEAEDCTLRLSFESEEESYLFFGAEVCDGETTMHAYGSGTENGDDSMLHIGLTLTGITGTTISHEGAVFVMDIEEGFGLTRHKESDSDEECDPDPAPCIVEEVYDPVECEEDDD